VSDSGEVRHAVVTREENKTTYLDYTDSTGAYESSVTAPTDDVTYYSQSSDGLKAAVSLPCGMQRDFIYDVDSEYKFKYVKELKEKTPDGLQKVRRRNKTYQDNNSDGIPDLITDEVSVNGKSTQIEHNTAAAKRIITSPEGRRATQTYDGATLRTDRLSVPGLYDTDYGYDTKGRLTQVKMNTRQTRFTYDPKGFLESVTDGEVKTTFYGHDQLGRLTSITRPDNGFVDFSYDDNGNLSVITIQAAVDHGFGYNTVNKNDAYHTPISGSYRFSYNYDRELTALSFPSQKQILYTYENTLLKQIQTPEDTIDLSYLCGGKLGTVSNGTEAVTYDYDGKLVTSESLTGTLNQALFYTYNNDFQPNSFTYAGKTINYSYDNDGLLTAAGAFTITRNAGNGLPEAVSGGALNLARTFNGYAEVDSQTITVNSQNVASWSLTRDNNGRITDKTEAVDGTTSGYAYTYDAVGRLLTVTQDSTLVEEYQYELNGTRTYEMNALRGIAGRSYSYSDEDHLLSAGSVTYAYDLDGFLTTKTDGSEVTTYNYSSRGELVSVDLPDGRVIEYLHDPLGRRIAKKVNGVIVEKYLWQSLTQLLAVYDGADNLLMRFEYADGRMPISMTKEGGIYYLIYDQLGSLRVVADGAGNVVKRIDYDSFGNIIADSNEGFIVPFGFAGGLHDRDTGLVRFGYRDYDPDVGRWTAKDPIFFAGGDTDL
jgi:RHS repeat-associated protein